MTPTANALYNLVTVGTLDQFNTLLAHPASVAGSWNPATGSGTVRFGTVAAALTARREA